VESLRGIIICLSSLTMCHGDLVRNDTLGFKTFLRRGSGAEEFGDFVGSVVDLFREVDPFTTTS